MESYYTRLVPLERELKFSSPEGYVPSLLELAHALDGLLVAGAPLSVGEGTLRRHRDVYFDTPQDLLAASGWALRQRTTAARVTLGLKGDARVSGALHERFELEVPAPATPVLAASDAAPAWPDELAAALADKLPTSALAELTARSVLVVTRVNHRLVHADAAADASGAEPFFIDLSFDEVVCRLPAGDPSDSPAYAPEARFHEVELEAGPAVTAHALEQVADALSAVLPLTASSVSKADRARALLAPFD